MFDVNGIYDSKQAAQELDTNRDALLKWLSRTPEYRPKRRFSGDDMLWTSEDIERVKEARQKRRKTALV